MSEQTTTKKEIPEIPCNSNNNIQDLFHNIDHHNTVRPEDNMFNPISIKHELEENSFHVPHNDTVLKQEPFDSMNALVNQELDESTSSVINPPERNLTCDQCFITFESEEVLNQHIMIAHGVPQCNYCTATFQTRSDLHNHIISAHPDMRCAKCCKVFTATANLVDHRFLLDIWMPWNAKDGPNHLSHKGSVYVPGRITSLRPTSSTYDLIENSYKSNHVVFDIKSEKKSSSLATTTSGSFYNNKHEQKLMSDTESIQQKPNPENKCPHCNRKFPTEIHLKTHLQYVHLPKSENFCKKCNCSFSNLELHNQLAHNNFCIKCNRSFFNLELHLQFVHKEFNCKKCGQTFALQVELDSHLLYVHKQKPKEKSDMEKSFKRPRMETYLAHQCKQVNLAFTPAASTPDVGCHFLSEDTGGSLFVQTYTCFYCSRTMASKQKLRIHLKSHFLAHRCSQCSLSFEKRSGLQSHFELVHERATTRRYEGKALLKFHGRANSKAISQRKSVELEKKLKLKADNSKAPNQKKSMQLEKRAEINGWQLMKVRK